MPGASLMQSNEMKSIHRQERAIILGREAQDFLVGESLVRAAQVGQRADVVPERRQTLNDGKREILVGEEPRHAVTRLRSR